MKPFSVAFKGWLLVMIPVVAQAGHHPGHGATESPGGGAALWIFLGIIAFVVIIAWLARKWEVNCLIGFYEGGFMAIDPVCRMEVDPARAAAVHEYQGTTYYF